MLMAAFNETEFENDFVICIALAVHNAFIVNSYLS